MTKVAFTALTGSHQYNLDLGTSDYDYQTFAYPAFEDLYDRALLNDTKITSAEDKVVHDVRKLGSMLSKSSTNAIQVLFSDVTTTTEEGVELYSQLTAFREDIARMNLPRLVDTSMGMFNQEVKRYKREIAAGNTVRAGKSAASAIRIAVFTCKYRVQGFDDFKKAIWFDEDNPVRHTLLRLKAGDTDELSTVEQTFEKYEESLLSVKPRYKSYDVDYEAIEAVHEIIKKHVRNQIKIELGGK